MEELVNLNHGMMAMGGLCEEVISLAGKAMITGDVSIAETVKPMIEEIDRKEKEIEDLCLRLLLEQQPVAGDLRKISAALKMITDMQRIGDQAGDILEITEYLSDSRKIPEGIKKPLQDKTDSESSTADGENQVRIGSTHIRDMAVATIKMVNESVDAYVKQDTDIAKQVIDYDDVVDKLFTEVKSALIQLIIQHPEYGEYSMDLLMIAKYFERIGDHAVNIGRWVLFAVTGERE